MEESDDDFNISELSDVVNRDSGGHLLAQYLQKKAGTVPKHRLFGEIKQKRMSVKLCLKKVQKDQNHNEPEHDEERQQETDEGNDIRSSEELDEIEQNYIRRESSKEKTPTNALDKVNENDRIRLKSIQALQRNSIPNPIARSPQSINRNFSPSDKLRRFTLNKQTSGKKGRELLKDFNNVLESTAGSTFSPPIASTPRSIHRSVPSAENEENLADFNRVRHDLNNKSPSKSATNFIESRQFTIQKGSAPGQVILTPTKTNNVQLTTQQNTTEKIANVTIRNFRNATVVNVGEIPETQEDNNNVQRAQSPVVVMVPIHQTFVRSPVQNSEDQNAAVANSLTKQSNIVNNENVDESDHDINISNIITEDENENNDEEASTMRTETTSNRNSNIPIDLASTKHKTIKQKHKRFSSSRKFSYTSSETDTDVNVPQQIHVTARQRRSKLRGNLALNRVSHAPINGEMYAAELKRQTAGFSNREILDLRRRRSKRLTLERSKQKSNKNNTLKVLNTESPNSNEIVWEILKRNEIADESNKKRSTIRRNGSPKRNERAPMITSKSSSRIRREESPNPNEGAFGNTSKSSSRFQRDESPYRNENGNENMARSSSRIQREESPNPNEGAYGNTSKSSSRFQRDESPNQNENGNENMARSSSRVRRKESLNRNEGAHENTLESSARFQRDESPYRNENGNENIAKSSSRVRRAESLNRNERAHGSRTVRHDESENHIETTNGSVSKPSSRGRRNESSNRNGNTIISSSTAQRDESPNPIEEVRNSITSTVASREDPLHSEIDCGIQTTDQETNLFNITKENFIGERSNDKVSFVPHHSTNNNAKSRKMKHKRKLNKTPEIVKSYIEAKNSVSQKRHEENKVKRSLYFEKDVSVENNLSSSETALTDIPIVPPPPMFQSETPLSSDIPIPTETTKTVENNALDFEFKKPNARPPKRKTSKKPNSNDNAIESENSDVSSLRRSKRARKEIPKPLFCILLEKQMIKSINDHNKSKTQNKSKNKNQSKHTTQSSQRMTTITENEILPIASSTANSYTAANSVTKKSTKKRNKTTLASTPHFDVQLPTINENIEDNEFRTIDDDQVQNFTNTKKLRVRLKRLNGINSTSVEPSSSLQPLQSTEDNYTFTTTENTVLTQRSEQPSELNIVTRLKQKTYENCISTPSNCNTYENPSFSSFDELTFTNCNGMDFAFYGTSEKNFGYMRFQPNQIKSPSRPKHYNMNFINISGKFTITIDDVNSILNDGDLVTVAKGCRYSIKNDSDTIGLILFMKK